MTTQCPHDFFQHRVGLKQHFVIPEPQYSIPQLREFLVAVRVIGVMLRVLATVHFDNQLRFKACKIGNETADRHLATESETMGIPFTPVPRMCRK